MIALIEQSGYKLIVKSPNDPTPLQPNHRSCKVFQTIQEAIDLAKGGEKILVYPGVYRENLWIEKPIHLCGFISEEEVKQRREAMKLVASSMDGEGEVEEKKSDASDFRSTMSDPSQMSEKELRKTASSRRAKNTNAAANQELKKKIEHERAKTKAIGSTNKIIVENADESESVVVYKANGGVISNITFRISSKTLRIDQEQDKPLVSCIEMDNGGLTLQGVTIAACDTGSGITVMNKSILIVMESIIAQCRDMGVWLLDRSQCTIDRSRIVSAKYNGICVSGESILHKVSHTDIIGCGLFGICLCDRSVCNTISSSSITQNLGDNIRVQNEARLKRITGCEITGSSEFGILFGNYPVRGFSEDDLMVKLSNNKVSENKMGDIYIEHPDYMGRYIKKYVRRKKK